MSTRSQIPRSIRGNMYGALGVGDILDMPRVRLTRAAVQTIGTAAHTVISFDNMVYDTDGWFTSAVPTQVTCRTAGVYDTAGTQVIWDVSGVGNYRFAYLVKNGVLPRIGLDFQPPSAGAERACNVATKVQLNYGDVLQLFCFQDSGGNLNTSTAGGTAPTAELNLCLISTT